MNKLVVIVYLLLAPLTLLAQQYHKEEGDDPSKRKQKVGVKIGFCESWVNGNTLQNMRPQTGIQGGVYYRININNSLNLQTELDASYRGARFNNGELGYSRLALFYIDLPVYLMVNFKGNNKSNLFFGPQLSYMVRSSLFLGNEYFATFSELPLRQFDFAAAAGFHQNFDILGLQLAFKYGLRNIARNFNNYPIPGKSATNGDIPLNDVQPSLRQLTSLRNFSVEFSLSF